MAAAAAAVRADNGDRELGTVADMDNHYAHLDQAALPRDCALVELDGHGRGLRPRLLGRARQRRRRRSSAS